MPPELWLSAVITRSMGHGTTGMPYHTTPSYPTGIHSVGISLSEIQRPGSISGCVNPFIFSLTRCLLLLPILVRHICHQLLFPKITLFPCFWKEEIYICLLCIYSSTTTVMALDKFHWAIFIGQRVQDSLTVGHVTSVEMFFKKTFCNFGLILLEGQHLLMIN